MKKYLSLLMILMLALPVFASAETFEASAQGFGGSVTVSLTVEDGKITDAVVTGENETPDYGGAAIPTLQEQLITVGSAEIDGVTGATFTSTAVKTAAADALALSRGEEKVITEAVMKDGRYVAYAESFNAGDGLTVTVDINDNKIRKIEVDTVHTSDMQVILNTAVDNLIPRMIEYQSVAVDAVCGATVSSNAIKAATTDCVKQALAAAGTDESAIENFYVSIPQSNEVVELETEVLVVGMGGSGIASAVSAAQNGAQVLVIDKAGRYGGTTALTCDVFAMNPPRVIQDRNNGELYQDSQVVMDHWLNYTEGDEKTEIVEKYINNSGLMLDWMIYDFGAQFADGVASWLDTNGFVTCFSWAPTNWKNCDSIYSYLGNMVDKMVELGGSYMLETEGYDLIYDEATNNVTGVKARSMVDGTEYVIKADAVILATGGYLGSAELQEQLLDNPYWPLKGVWHHYGSRQNDGKMWTAAMNIGAGTYNADMSPEVHTSSTEVTLTDFGKHYLEGQVNMIAERDAYWTEGDLPNYLGWSSDSLGVAPTGERFTSETGIGMLDPWKAGPYFYSIWSDSQLANIETDGLAAVNANIFFGSLTTAPNGTPIPNKEAVIDAAVEAGIMFRADSIEALAEQIGMDSAVLKNTVDTYNGYCETGVDEQFGKPAEFLKKVEGNEYYAVKMCSYAYGSCGGLDIDANFRVLKTDGTTAIGNLYAVGTDSMGVLFTDKKPYVTYGGVNNSWSLTSGMLCGQEIAEGLAK